MAGTGQVETKPLVSTNAPVINAIEEAFRHGLMEEEYNQNLSAAIKDYQAVITGLDSSRKMAATAIFRLGECYRKQGQTNEAVVQFERLLRDFSDQTQLVDMSQRRVVELAPAKLLASAGPVSALKALNPAQVQLVRDEMKLIERQLADVEKQIMVGGTSTLARVPFQRDMLVLQRQLPENTEPAKQKALVEQQIKLVELLLQVTKKQIEQGRAVSGDIIPIERDILGLKRELAAISQSPTESSNVSVAAAPTEEEAKALQQFKAIIKDSPDLINAKTGGQTHLQLAANRGQLVVAQFLLANHADVAAKSENGDTALHQAVQGGHKGMVELLLEHGANPNAPGNRGQTPLFLAALNGYQAVAEVLLSHKAEINPKGIRFLRHELDGYVTDFTPLHAAVIKELKAMAEFLLEKGADVNGPSRWQEVYYTGTQALSYSGAVPSNYLDGEPLHYAAVVGNETMAKLLLAHKANINARNSFSFTPLLLAAKNNKINVAKLLLEYKAAVNDAVTYAFGRENLERAGTRTLYKNITGYTALHFAVENNQALAELLLANQANPNAKNQDGLTPLLLAAGNAGAAALVESLLAHGAEVNVQQQDNGNTALSVAVGSNATNNVKVILAHKPDLTLRDLGGITPLQRAVLMNYAMITELLLEAGADPNVVAEGGDTPLHWAVNNRQKDIAKLLLDHKTNVNLQNQAGLTPFTMVSRPPSSPQPGMLPPPGIPMTPGILPPPPPAIQMTSGSALMRAQRSSPIAPNEMAELLRQYGANENPDRASQIALSRPALNELEPLFYRGTNAYSRFTLLELLACRDRPFPDLANITIHRLSANGETNNLKVNVETILNAGDPAKDVWLQWGDVVEVPVMEHLVDATWSGLPTETRIELARCLRRKINFIVKGKTNQVIIIPGIARQNSWRGPNDSFELSTYGAFFDEAQRFDFSTLRWKHNSSGTVNWTRFSVVDRVTQAPIDGGLKWLTDSRDISRVELNFSLGDSAGSITTVLTLLRAVRLADAIRDANVLLTSSDLTRVKVKRTDPITKQPLEMVFNLAMTDPKTGLWLRDKDIIEIPERGE